MNLVIRLVCLLAFSASFVACAAERAQEESVQYPEPAQRSWRSYGESRSSYQRNWTDDDVALEEPAPAEPRVVTPAPVTPARPRVRHHRHRVRLMCSALPVSLRSAIDCWTMGCEEPFLEPARRVASCNELFGTRRGRAQQLPPGRYRCQQAGRAVSVTIPSPQTARRR